MRFGGVLITTVFPFSKETPMLFKYNVGKCLCALVLSKAEGKCPFQSLL